MVITFGQQYNVGEKPTVILCTFINRHAGTPNKTKTKYTMSLYYNSICNIGSRIGMGVDEGNLLVTGVERYILTSTVAVMV